MEIHVLAITSDRGSFDVWARRTKDELAEPLRGWLEDSDLEPAEEATFDEMMDLVEQGWGAIPVYKLCRVP